LKTGAYILLTLLNLIYQRRKPLCETGPTFFQGSLIRFITNNGSFELDETVGQDLGGFSFQGRKDISNLIDELRVDSQKVMNVHLLPFWLSAQKSG
jgi:hypothetical protein